MTNRDARLLAEVEIEEADLGYFRAWHTPGVTSELERALVRAGMRMPTEAQWEEIASAELVRARRRHGLAT
jgi:hypothetical protein